MNHPVIIFPKGMKVRYVGLGIKDAFQPGKIYEVANSNDSAEDSALACWNDRGKRHWIDEKDVEPVDPSINHL